MGILNMRGRMNITMSSYAFFLNLRETEFKIVLEMLYECVECMFSNNLNDDPKCLDPRIVSFMIVNTNVIRINSTKGPVGQDIGII